MLNCHLVPYRSRQRRAVWDPLNMLDNFFEELGGNPVDGADFSPHLDVVENDKEISIDAELPGLDEKDLNVSLENDVLTITGEKKQETEKTEGNYYRIERRYGSFQREVALPPDTVDPEKIDAKFKNGVLTILLTKKAEKEKSAKKISVKSE